MSPGALALLAAFAAGQGVDPPGPSADGERLAVYVLTFGPGPRIWERFGHNAILVRDTATGASRAYDYGRFRFDATFFPRFAYGRMQYAMGREDGAALVNWYVNSGRSVVMQELALPPAARSRLLEFLEGNFADDQGRYQYDYYLDNCSTRVRDAIDAVVDGAIRAALEPRPSGVSWRWHTRRSLENNPLNWFGVDASLGHPADREISRYEETFLPPKLREYLGDVTVPGPDGQAIPLVAAEFEVAASERYAVPPQPSNRTWPFLGAGVAVGLLFAGLGRQAAGGGRVRRGFLVLAGLWALLTALGGATLVFFWGLSEHAIAHRNENVLQFNILAFALVAALAGAVRGREGRLITARRTAILIAALSALGLMLKGLPGFGQANLEIIAFTLPAHLGLAAGLTLLGGAPAPS